MSMKYKVGDLIWVETSYVYTRSIPLKSDNGCNYRLFKIETIYREEGEYLAGCLFTASGRYVNDKQILGRITEQELTWFLLEHQR